MIQRNSKPVTALCQQDLGYFHDRKKHSKNV